MEAAADFSGYATKAGLVCSDGRTILKDAFAHQDKVQVPLVWQHRHNEPTNVLGYAILHNKEDGVYCYGYFNDTTAGQETKKIVQHGDVKCLSIYANQLVERSKQVMHGFIREVSVVLSGANPGAFIDFIAVKHDDGDVEVFDDEAIIFTGLAVEHNQPESDEDLQHATDTEEETEGKTAQEVFESLDADQLQLFEVMVNAALKANPEESGEPAGDSAQHSDEAPAAEEIDNPEGDLTHTTEGTEMVHSNIFEGSASATGGNPNDTLTHENKQELVDLMHKHGTWKQAVEAGCLAHAEGDYGITNIEVLFPDAQAINSKPEWITRRMEWVETVLNGTRKLPFSKIKSLSADLTHEEARAKGYIKGNVKKEQFFEIAFRETGPKTIYKKQKLDRDDILDITDFDVVAWIWVEMRFMLREEIARAILVGDGREVDDEDKIDETKIRPIATDNEFYTDVLTVPANVSGEAMVEAVVRGREAYKGAGDPTAFMTRSVLNDMLLLKDKVGRRLYRTRADLAAELEVSSIVLVPVMEGATTDDGDLLMILVNLSDYSVGSTKGGEVSQFDDFDIDVNQYKYLLEGRMSGALTSHKTAQVVVRESGTLVSPTVPTFNATTGVLTVPSVTGVVYKNAETDATLSSGAQSAIAAGATISVEAVPATGYHFPHNFDADWDYTRDA